MPDIAIIIVNYNAGDLLQKCIQAVLAQSIKPQRIIVLDNNSHDDSIATITKYTPQVEIIRLDENTGFARGNNIAIKHAQDCEWVVLLNPDAFPEPDWLETFASTITKYPKYSMLASCMVNYADPKKYDSAGDAYYVSGKAWNLKHNFLREESDPDYTEVFAPCAGAGFYRRDAIIEAGLFDESYFCYYEDVDLGFRMQLLGYKCLYMKNAIVHHVGSAIAGRASDFTIFHAHRNMVWTYFKNMPMPLLIYYLPQHIWVNIGTILAIMRKGRLKLILKTKFAAIKGLPAAWRKRRPIQAHRKVSSRELLQVISGKSLLKKFLRIT